eukprot:CAMPEP_0181300704 /NCGR_PEP_ID=MMETSP1101-20121128/7032_1 /TAXON_ID=46948 /ORGANISM="Rhodomonas abbreviata, Strain Caron Lab Isolate" /LENGTH=749 /DNA_ID=CAMNT_0023405959 /DNA_START=219 /DNA_END=2465 /DNA_ORIENTATION=+
MADGKPKKKIRPGLIEADPVESALLVHYEVEEILDGETVDKKQQVKKIKLNALSPDCDLPAVAQDVVDKCKLISQAKLPLVIKVLEALISRIQIKTQSDEDDYVEWDNQWQAQRRGEVDRYIGEGEKQFEMDANVAISLDNLDSYLELLYEDAMEEKIKGTFMILQLVRDPDNLEHLITNEQFLGVITRVFREEAKKSMDLMINLVYVFFAFSNFNTFHPAMTEYKMGDMVMKVVELELKRDQHRKEELQQRSKDLSAEEREKEAKKMKITEKKQDKLLYVCFHVLLNLAEDITVERKMKKRNITPMLISMLQRKGGELLLLAIAFLKKLSIFRENKDEMRENGVASAIVKFVPGHTDEMTMAALRLMLNLSFDTEVRGELVKEGVVPKLVELLKRPQFRHVALKLLYQISMDDKCKSMFTYTECIPMIINMIQNFPERMVEKTLAALGVNLATNARNAEAMASPETLNALLSRLFQTKDPLLAKMLRNLSQHEGPVKMRFAEYVSDLAALARKTESPDLLVELLGLLANMTMTDIPFSQILLDYDMVSFLHKHLAQGASEDDIILEVVIFIGTCVLDPKCAPIFADNHLVQVLYDLMADKQEDDEIVLQITYTFFRCLQHQSTRDVLLNHTQVVSYFVDLLYDKNEEIRKMADQTLDVVMEFDAEWARQIRLRKFQIYNAEWLQAVEREDQGLDAETELLQARMAHVRMGQGVLIEDMAEGVYGDPGSPHLRLTSDDFAHEEELDDDE